MIKMKSCGILIALLLAFTTLLPALNTNYIGNQAPLVDTPFTPLPVGTVKADGWLLKMLEFQRDGVTGNAEALYAELQANNAWRGGSGDNWERGPYYLKGMLSLAYVMNDPGLIQKAQAWINDMLKTQRNDGYFGPPENVNNDWWPRMPMLYALKDYYEATGDVRILPFLTKYFQYQAANLPNRPLIDWGKSRVGDNIDIVLWLYNHTKASFLLALADTLKNQGYDLSNIFTNNTFKNFGSDFQPKHNVNVSEDIKMPVIYYQRSKATIDRDAFIAGDINLLRDNGQVTGMSSGTEMLSGKSPLQGVETCAVVERMQSNEEAQMILGNAYIGDQLEKIAFNSLPACFNKTDIHVHQYYQLPNQVQSVSGSRGYEEDYANSLMPGPFSGFPCCRFNMHMGWPYFVKNLWAATIDNGLAIMAYGPSHLTAKVASGTSVTLTETTNYPFEEQVRLTLNTTSTVSFPLKLRIPTWCATPQVLVNGTIQNGVVAGSFYTISRSWNNYDTVTLNFPMSIKASTQYNNSIAIERGPLVYSLKIGEKWTVTNTSNLADYNENSVTPTTPWNYGLVIDRNNPAASITVNKGAMPSDNNPYLQSPTPITLTASAKQIPSWTLSGVNAAEVPGSPISSNQATVAVTLVPYGAENIRVSYFPEIGEGSGGSPPVFIILNKNSGMALDLIGGDSANGARINQWTYDYNGQNQRWLISPTENGDHFKLISSVTGKSACIAEDSNASGAQLHDWTYTGNNPSQQWDLIDAGNGWYKIRNVRSGMMLDVNGFGTTNDTKVQQWTDNGGQSNQLWRLQAWGDYFIKNSAGKYICVQGMGSSNGSKIIQYQFENNPWFKWRLENAGEGWSKFSSLNALTRALCVGNASTTAGFWTHLWEYNVANIGDQKVRIEPRTNGKFKFYFAHDGMSWDIPSGGIGNDVPLQQQPSNNNTWQEFSLERAF